MATLGCWCDPLGLVANAAKPSPANQSFGDFLQNVANRAEAKGIRDGWGQMGTGPRQGTLKHSYADRLVVRYQRMTGEQSAIRTEVTQRNGMPAPRNSLGSSRADAFSDPALGSTGEVGDYKVTPLGISPDQMSNYNQNFPGSPILTIRPQ